MFRIKNDEVKERIGNVGKNRKIGRKGEKIVENENGRMNK
jgi:hypothetical protein